MADAMLRREFLFKATVGGLATGLLVACNAPAPSAGSSATASGGGGAPTSATAAAGAASKPSTLFPTYIPLQNGPKPDYASASPQYEDGWDNYPMPPIQAWTREPPGLGSTITAFTNAYNPPATPLDQ